jgi:thioester reductase-like protein
VTGVPPVWIVTGATGFLGSALLAGLLRRGCSARCVVRGATEADRAAKLRAALGDRAADGWSRIEIVPGNLGEEHLGLSPGGFSALGRGVSHVLHCGARVNMVLPYRLLYAENVRATEELLDLAESHAARFCYIGSLAAVARGVTREPFELIDLVTGGYALTKWTADRLVSVAHQEGRLKAAIFRPARVTADLRTPRSNPDDLLERVIRLCVRLGAVPLLQTSVRLSPVGWVSDVILALSQTDDVWGSAYHVMAVDTLPWSGVIEVLRDSGYALAELPYARWLSAATAAGRYDPQVARVCSALPADGLSFDDRQVRGPLNARRKLADAYPELRSPPLLLKRTIQTWQQTGQLPVPRSARQSHDPQSDKGRT